MALSFLTQRRTVLLMSDEFLSVYKAVSGGREFVESVPWDADNFEAHVARLLERDCGKKPVVILNDMIEQHYRKERLSQKGVGVMDKRGVVKRKLNMAFPNYPVRAQLQIKDKGEKNEKSTSTYIFAAVSNSEQLLKVTSAVRRSLVSVVGFFLLPVESSDMLKKLATKTVTDSKQRSAWTVLISPHKGGGLRQIVVKNDTLALTRMSMISATQGAPGDWAAEVYQEFQATMGYLARFGYHADDGLNIVVISDPAAGDALQELMNASHNYAALTAGQAGALLGIPIRQSLGGGESYADILHVAWAASKSKFIMPMQSMQMDRISKPRKIVTSLSILLFFTALFFAYQAISAQWSLLNINTSLTQEAQNKTQLDAQYQKEIARIEASGYDIKLMQAAIAVYTELEQKRIDILPLLRSIGQGLGRDLHADELLVKQLAPSQAETMLDNLSQGEWSTPDTVTVNVENPFVSTVIIKYPGTTDIDVGNQEIRDLQKRLALFLPRYDVAVTKYLKDYGYVDEVVVEANGTESDDDIAQDFVAELRVRSKQ